MRKLKWWIILVPLCIAALVVVCFCINQDDVFDSGVWKDQYQYNGEDNPRYGMIFDLEQKHLRKGMSKEKVRNILGPPDIELDDADIYNLGVSVIDYDQYIIKYDIKSTVIDYHILPG